MRRNSLRTAHRCRDDAALDFVAEAGLTGVGHHVGRRLRHVLRGHHAQTIAHAVVTSEIRAHLRRHDDVIGAQSVLEARAGDLDDLGTHRLELLHGLVEACLDTGLEAFAAELLHQADPHALQVAAHALAGGFGHGARPLRNRRGVTLVMTADDLLQQCGIEHGARDRANLVERGGHGYGAETGDAAIGGLDANGTGQCALLANGAAGVGTQANGASKALTAAAEPPPEPPGTRSTSHGLAVCW